MLSNVFFQTFGSGTGTQGFPKASTKVNDLRVATRHDDPTEEPQDTRPQERVAHGEVVVVQHRKVYKPVAAFHVALGPSGERASVVQDNRSKGLDDWT